jgi:hypothetical protein
MTVSSTFVSGQVLTATDANLMANSGLTYIASGTFSGAGTKSLNSCFTTENTNYKILVQIDSVTANSVVALRWRAGGTDNNSPNYYWSTNNMLAGGTQSVNAASSDTSWTLVYTSTTIPHLATIEVAGPQKNQSTMATLTASGDNPAHTAWAGSTGGLLHLQGYQADGLTVFTSSGTMQGTITVYGYRQA